MFHVVRKGGVCPYGISYLVDISKEQRRFAFAIILPWFGYRVSYMCFSLPNPFS